MSENVTTISSVTISNVTVDGDVVITATNKGTSIKHRPTGNNKYVDATFKPTATKGQYLCDAFPGAVITCGSLPHEKSDVEVEMEREIDKYADWFKPTAAQRAQGKCDVINQLERENPALFEGILFQDRRVKRV